MKFSFCSRDQDRITVDRGYNRARFIFLIVPLGHIPTSEIPTRRHLVLSLDTTCIGFFVLMAILFFPLPLWYLSLAVTLATFRITWRSDSAAFLDKLLKNMWKNAVIEASDRIFPGLVYHDREKEFWDMEHLVRSSLPLQMALYLNVWTFPAWFLITLGSLDAKYYLLTTLYKFLTITVLIVFSLLESVRLYFGYLGNLAEKIPELASFWLISTLFQLPLAMFMLIDGSALPPIIERIAHGVMIILLIVEIITGTIALKQTADHHAKRFSMAKIYGIDNLAMNTFEDVQPS